MPGIHFVHADPHIYPLDKIIAAICRSDGQAGEPAETFYRDDCTFAGGSRFSGYPLEVIDSEPYLFVLEGNISKAGDPSPAAAMEKLAELIFREAPDPDKIGGWLTRHGGDFVALIREKRTGRWGCINDVLGRLPLYYSDQDGMQVLSRDIRIPAMFFKTREMDRMALAQYLLFGFPLGEKTIIENIERLPAGSLLRWGPKTGNTLQRRVFEFNFDVSRSARAVREEAERLEPIFITACRRLSESRPEQAMVLSLSGGLDSRTVAAGLYRAGIRFDAVTYENVDKTTALDISYAREVARKLGIEWHPLHLTAPKGADIIELMNLKGGMNSASMAFYIPFLSEIKQRWGRNIVYVTGDGGDKTLPPLHPARRFSSDTALTDFIIARHDVMPLKTVAALLDIAEKEIKSAIREQIGTYPETSYRNKYVHFMIYERAFKWLFEGEDRNRCYFWSGSPFYDFDFFQAAMTCPARFKRNHCLYSELLKRLSPDVADIIDMNRGAAVTSSTYRRKEMIFSFLSRYPGLSRRLKNRISPPAGYSGSSPSIQYLRRRANKGSFVGEYFMPGELKKICDSPERLSRTAMDNLLTVANTIEYYIEGKQGLEEYGNQIFN